MTKDPQDRNSRPPSPAQGPGTPPQSTPALLPTRLDPLATLLAQREGASIAVLMSATGWHSVRGARAGPLGGLDQQFNSLDAQREACEAFVKSQKSEGWRSLAARYDDGGVSGGSMQRPALKRLLADIAADQIEVVVVYKIDRLTRSLADFARMVELFDRHQVSFVSVTQAFNTTSSMGRLTLNVLLSFAQFEREVTSEY